MRTEILSELQSFHRSLIRTNHGQLVQGAINAGEIKAECLDTYKRRLEKLIDDVRETCDYLALLSDKDIPNISDALREKFVMLKFT